VTFWVRLMARLGQVETRHWVAACASVLLHLAVMLGLRQAPPPPPETVSFEIALKSPEALRLKPPKLKSGQTDRRKPRQPAQVKKARSKEKTREPHTLEATLRPENQPRKDAPQVSLPEALVAEAAQAVAPAPRKSAAMSEQPVLAGVPAEAVQPVATSGGAAAVAEGGDGGVVAGGSEAPSGQAGMALTASRSMALAPGGGDVSQGAQASASPGHAAEGAGAGGEPANFSASGGVGVGLNLASGAGAHANAASESPSMAGGEPRGLRLTAGGTLSAQPEFPQGQGGLTTGRLALEAGAAQALDGQGRGQSLASVVPGGASVSPLRGAAAGPGPSGQATAIEGPAGSRLAGGAGPAPGRLAGVQVPNKGLSGPAGTRPAGNSSHQGKALALAPGEPGSGPQWAVLMVPVQTGAPMPWGRGPGVPDRRGGGQMAEKVTTAPGGGDVSAGGEGTAGARLTPSGMGKLASVAGKGFPGSGGGGGHAVAPALGPATPAGATLDGGGRGMTKVEPAQRQVLRQDSRMETLDVLAPSNYCPLPLHPQPDNRPPQAAPDQVELPSYAASNPSFVYPVMANVYGVEGTLIMRVQVLADGSPGQMLLKQSSGSGILDRDAREQLARWRFNPARKNGQPVAAWVDIPVTYRLPEGRK